MLDYRVVVFLMWCEQSFADCYSSRSSRTDGAAVSVNTTSAPSATSFRKRGGSVPIRQNPIRRNANPNPKQFNSIQFYCKIGMTERSK